MAIEARGAALAARSILVLGLACAPLAAQQRPWSVEDVMGLQSVSSAAMSPDGRWVAFAVTGRDTTKNESESDLWLVEAGGGQPIQMTRDGDASSPAWAPDGAWIAFLSGRDGKAQVFGIRPGGGEAWKVTEWEPGIQSFRVAPDGQRIAFTAARKEGEEAKERERRRGSPMVWDSANASDWVHLWTAPLDGESAGDVSRVSPDGYSVGGFVWSPDGGSLAWSGSTSASEESLPGRDRPTGFALESQVYVQAVGGARPRAVTAMRGQVSPEAWVPGLGLIVAGSNQELGTYNRQLWLVADGQGAAARSLTAGLDENAGFVGADAGRLLVEARHRTGARLYQIALRGGEPAGPPEVLTDDRLLYSGFTASDDLAHLAFVANGPTTPPDVFASPTGRFAPRKLTDLNPQIRRLAHGEQRVIQWRSREDGEEIEGVLTLPVGYREGDAVPLLLVIHGGPSGVSSNAFNPGGRYPIQVFAGLGYASLEPNYRGSTGYGERFRGLNRGHISGSDWVDVDSGVDHLVATGVADPNRLGIMGWSFGGHHTFWGITQTERFKAASAGAGATDLVSMYSQTDRPGFYHTYLGPRPWEDFGLYDERSAYRRVARVTTPLLIQVGEKDERVPAEQSIQFYEAMSGIGKAPVKLVIYPGQGHGFRDVALIRDMMLRNVEWFTKWIPVRRTSTDAGIR